MGGLAKTLGKSILNVCVCEREIEREKKKIERRGGTNENTKF